MGGKPLEKGYSNSTLPTMAEDEDNVLRIEVFPGRFEEARTAEETWLAYQNQRVEIVRCKSCNEEMACINDAKYVVCLQCHHWGRLRGGTRRKLNLSFFNESFVGGVGVGVPVSRLRGST